MSGSIRKRFTLPVAPRRAFSLLSDRRLIRSWSGQSGTVEPRIGGRFSMFGGWVRGTVLAFQPGVYLAYTWLPQDWKKGTPSSIVVFRFTADGRKTRVSLLHKGLPSQKALRDHAAGWDEHVILPLKEYLISKGA